MQSMQFKIFISSVQREFAGERKLLAEYIRKDAILGKFFEVFVFEEVPAQERSASDVYLSEVDACDIYLGILGATYGHVDRKGVSATEREYERAEKKQKERICFVKTVGGEREPAEAKFVARVNAERTRKGFADWDGLRVAVYAALANFLEAKGLISVLPFDAAKTARVQMKDLSVTKIRAFVRDAREKRRWNIPANAAPMKVLTALELVDDKGDILNPAALLFGKRPQRHFLSSEVKCAQFYVDRVSKPMADHQIYEGDVFELVDQATRFVMTHISNWVGTRETGDTAQVPTKFELPHDAVREGIVNAVCHRDYTSLASVQVMLFKDRLEIWSPGALPKGMTIAKLSRAHKSMPVNPLLARAMYLRGYIERTGTGTEDMIAKCREWGVPRPSWTLEDGDDFRVIIRRNVQEVSRVERPQHLQETTRKDGVKLAGEKVGHTENHTENHTVNTVNAILKSLADNPSVTIAELCVITGKARPTINEHIAHLKAKNRIRRVGPDKGGHWEVVK